MKNLLKIKKRIVKKGGSFKIKWGLKYKEVEVKKLGRKLRDDIRKQKNNYYKVKEDNRETPWIEDSEESEESYG